MQRDYPLYTTSIPPHSETLNLTQTMWLSRNTSIKTTRIARCVRACCSPLSQSPPLPWRRQWRRAAAAVAAAAACLQPAALVLQILRPLQLPLVRQSHKFGIIVLVHHEAPASVGLWLAMPVEKNSILFAHCFSSVLCDCIVLVLMHTWSRNCLQMLHECFMNGKKILQKEGI
jgi:hypothetical protein